MTTSAGLTAALADFVVGMAERPVPDAAAAVVRTGFIDTIATMLAGRDEPVVGVVRGFVAAQAGPLAAHQRLAGGVVGGGAAGPLAGLGERPLDRGALGPAGAAGDVGAGEDQALVEAQVGRDGAAEGDPGARVGLGEGGAGGREVGQ